MKSQENNNNNMVSNDNGDMIINTRHTNSNSKKRPIFVNLAYACKRLRNCFPQKFDCSSCQEWIRHPINIAIFIWIVCVTFSGAILLMLAIGVLDHALPIKSQRYIWTEVNHQILNALFTISCVYQHPKIIRHNVLLFRWRPDDDILNLRRVYCNGGVCKPRERAHMMVVIVLLHVNFVAQYVLCGLYLGYGRSDRPAVGVGICVGVTIGAPAIAGAYTLLGPLGRNYDTEIDVERVEYIYWVAKNRAKNSGFPCRCLIHY